MLLPYQQLLQIPVMSLQTGVELAHVKDILLDPRNLKVVAFELEGKLLDSHPSFLRIEDIRELGSIGIIVDSNEEFVGVDDVIKIKQVHEFDFHLLNLDVYEQKGTKLGKVHEYTLDGSAFAVQQITVKRPLIKSFTENELIIHRSQIVEVSNEKVVVRSTAHKEELAVSDTIKHYANPFRSSQPAGPETVDIDD